jgi:hypothetical protein
MKSLFAFHNGWKLENGGSHQISKAQTTYDELKLSGGKWNHEFGFAMDENKNEKGQNHNHLKKEKN